MEYKNKKINLTSILGIVIAMMLICTMVFQLTLSWLEKNSVKSSAPTTMANVDASVSEILDQTSYITIPDSNNIQSINLSSATTITNNSDVGVLLKVFYALYKDDGSKILAMKKDFSSFNINTTFISADKNVEQACAGDYYYNAVLEANTSVNLINTITPAIDSSLLGQTLRLKIQAEVVNYIGGPYYTWRDLPWPDYPPAWFVNQSYITKVDASTVTPRIPGTFADFSKIELTAKTNPQGKYFSETNSRLFVIMNSPNEFFGIGTDNAVTANNWIAGGQGRISGTFKNFQASMSPAEYHDNNWHTITFTWNGVTWEDLREDKFITLVWDQYWSKKTSYKQIKFWNTEGKLVYDLRPDDRSGTNTGKFYNYLDGTVLDMYTNGTPSATVTDSVYATSDNLLYWNNRTDGSFEYFNTGASVYANGLTGVVAEENGNKFAKFTKVGNVYRASFIFRKAEMGHTYNVSFKYKTNVPREYFYSSGTNYNTQSFFAYPSYTIVNHYYGFSGDWEFSSLTFSPTAEYGSISIEFFIPDIATENSGYYVAIDDIVVHKIS